MICSKPLRRSARPDVTQDDTDGRPSGGSFCVIALLEPCALSCWDNGQRLSKGYSSSGKPAQRPAAGSSSGDARMRGCAGADGAAGVVDGLPYEPLCSTDSDCSLPPSVPQGITYIDF